MHTLIRLLAHAIATHLQRGSHRGAILGCILAMLATIGAVFLLTGLEKIQSPWAWLIPLTLLAALTGALLGAMVGPAAPPVDLARAGSIRITRLNKGLVPLFFVLLFGILGGFVLAYPHKNRADSDPIACLLFALTAIACVFQGFSILWIDFGPQIIVYRLFRRSCYSLADVANAGFEQLHRGSYSLAQLSDQFAIRFDDGFSITVEVPPHKAPALSQLFLEASKSAENP